MNKMKKTILILSMLLSLALAGCVSSKITETTGTEAISQEIGSVAFGDQSIRIEIEDNREPWLIFIEPKIVDGLVYLYPSYIRSEVTTTIFEIDLSGLELPVDWKQKVYWIHGEDSDSAHDSVAPDGLSANRMKLEPAE